jgi:allantoinase
VPVDLLIRSRRLLLPDGFADGAVAIEGGTFKALLGPSSSVEAREVLDAGDLVVMPGLIDTHAHINEPGRTDWEGFDTATRAAAAGGITTVVDMPLNCIPVTTSVAALRTKLDAVAGKAWVDHGFWGGVIPGNRSELAPMVEAGALGFKAFLIDSGIPDFPLATAVDLRAAAPVLAECGVPLLAHAELAGSSPPSEGGNPRSYASYLASRPAAWETAAVQLLVDVCRASRCRVHVVHLSAAEALAAAGEARREGLPLSLETCPHYLSFASEEIPDGRTELKCAPPIRERENRERLWRALLEGEIDLVVSDHSPCSPPLKLLDEGDFARAWGGIAGLQFGLSLIATQARARGFSLTDVARWMCERPAALAGLSGRKGRIAVGFDADVVVFDPEATMIVAPEDVLHRHKLTPYLGQRLTGAVRTTILRGKTIFDRGAFIGAPRGQHVRRSAHG